MGNEDLKLSASNFGFDAGWVADVLTTWGADVLAIAVEAARNGLSVGLIVEILRRFGPGLLELAVSWLTKRSMLGATGDVLPGGLVKADELVAGLDPTLLSVLIDKYLPAIMTQLLPAILDKYGDQIIKGVIDMVIKNLLGAAPVVKAAPAK